MQLARESHDRAMLRDNSVVINLKSGRALRPCFGGAGGRGVSQTADEVT